jgi:hypothetical protein
MAFVDTAKSNPGAIKLFKRMGYGKPEAEVWMSKMIQRAGRARILKRRRRFSLVSRKSC